MSDLRSGLLLVYEEAVEKRLPDDRALSRCDFRDSRSEARLSDVGDPLRWSKSIDVSRDSPGSPRRLAYGEPSAVAASSLLFLYAAEPTPRSAVCLNHEGSLELSDAAIWSLLGSGSSTDAPRECEALVSTAAIETGRLEASLDVGLRCCHESVPERARFVALGATLALAPAPGCDDIVVDAELLCDVVLDLLIAPNP
jgi:hypothetical protein